MAGPASVARLKITLDGVEPKVVRRVEVPLGIRLDRLHLVIQEAMGWTNSHLYGFEVGRETWGETGFGFEDDEQRPAAKTTLDELLAETGKKTFHYIYDYGDDWCHTVKVERTRPAEPEVLYPRLVEAVGRCPPEDVGGAPGYAMFLEAMTDPTHPEHATMREWHGHLEDPKTAPLDELRGAVERLAKGWAPKQSRTRQPRG